MDTIFQIAVLIMSVVIHEVSHGYAARRMGDRTAEYAGRLTLNPIPHIDMWGSILIPAFLVLSGSSFVIGWAKPVPVNPYNLRNARWGEAFVAVAGPLSNLAIATIFGLAIRFGFVTENTFEIMLSIVMVNLVLAIFNLVPIPPMDGSKILFAFLPDSLESWRASVEKYGIIFAVLFIIFLWQYFTPLIMWLLSLLLGA